MQNAKVIDLIFAADGEVVLQMIENRPWMSAAEQPHQLGEKFDNYLEYVLGGWLVRQYPQHAGKKVCFELSCLEPPRAEAAQLVADMQTCAKENGFELRVVPLEGSWPLAESSAAER